LSLIVLALEVSENAVREDHEIPTPNLFNVFEILDHTGLKRPGKRRRWSESRAETIASLNSTKALIDIYLYDGRIFCGEQVADSPGPAKSERNCG
jgi:hypothetical protein